MRAAIALFFFILAAICGFGQELDLSNLKEYILEPELPRQQIDSLTVIPASVELFDISGQSKLEPSFYHLDNNFIIWDRTDIPSPLRISYRVLPFDLKKRLSHLDTTKIREANALIGGFRYNENDQQLIDFKGLDYNGSFARGLSFGNKQDLVLNSNFNLQLAGELGDGIEITAAMTDRNIPLQPEGNTRQLRDFDRVFIQLKKENNRLIAGDYELQRPPSYFMNYYKKLQGLTAANQRNLFEKGILSSSASIAVSRGEFARNNIRQIEGNQGPYKLQGAEGERFVIILAGTEKVSIDGELLTRGIEEDYVIDYNRGEITFTSKRLISKDSRIVVEFEYSDQNYLRSLYAFNTEYRQDKLQLYFNLFSEQDSKNSSTGQSLSNEQKSILSNAGDNPINAVVNSLDSLDNANPGRATYQLKDSLISCNGVDTLLQVLLYSTDPDSARYVAGFSYVGPGNGHYLLDNEQIANERVYKWIRPDPLSCSPGGDYEPVMRLVAPKQQQLITMGGAYDFSKNTSFKTELAISQNDQNRFSKLDANDDTGIALYSSLNKAFPLGKDSLGWSVNTAMKYEFVQQHFKALNPYRSSEFLRDWNIANEDGSGEAPVASEHLGIAEIGLSKTGLGNITYRLSSFLRDSIYQGYKHLAQVGLKKKGWDLSGRMSLLNTDEARGKTRFFRPNLELSKTFSNEWLIGIRGEREKSDRFKNQSDSLAISSFFFDRFELFTKSSEEKNWQLGSSYRERHDYTPLGKDYRKKALSKEVNIQGDWKLKNNLQWTGNLTYRRLEIPDSTLTSEKPANTYLGRVDLKFNLFKGAIRSFSTYEIGSGQEPKLEFSYQKVETGTGAYIWLDTLYNKDGKIQPFEMEIAPFADQADYIRIATFSDEFVRTNNLNFNQSLQINPKAIWFSKKGLRGFLSKFSTQSGFKINRKTLATSAYSWNPFELDIANEELVALNANIRHILFYNRGNPKFDIQIGQLDNRSRIIQTSGFESRRKLENFLRFRWNMSKSLALLLSGRTGDRQSDSEASDSKRYLIRFYNTEPQLTFLSGQNFRTILSYKFETSKNTSGDENAAQNDLKLELTYNRSAKSSLRSSFSFIQINFDGNANSPLGFVMLNGLQNGRNFLWNLTFDRQLAKNIQINLSYEGRKTGTAKVVHTGRAQVVANF